jgi:hypothetical protein
MSYLYEHESISDILGRDPGSSVGRGTNICKVMAFQLACAKNKILTRNVLNFKMETHLQQQNSSIALEFAFGF